MDPEERVLDRIPEFDERSRNFQIRTLLDSVGIRSPLTKVWKTGPTLDQGSEGACVGFGHTHFLAAEPTPNTGLDNTFAIKLYKEAQKLDEWPGEDYSGTSVLAGAKASQKLGYTNGYRWTGAGSGRVIDDILDTISWVCPVIFGWNWARSMFNPRPSGLMEVDLTDIAGGHCLAGVGILLNHILPGETKARDLVVCQNSWGPSWGKGGLCYFDAADVERIMEMQGEGLVILHENLVIPNPPAPTPTPGVKKTTCQHGLKLWYLHGDPRPRHIKPNGARVLQICSIP